MIRLLDVNVLMALAWPNHIHHRDAHAWFRDAKNDGWATCPVTESGFVRVSSNVRVVSDAVRPVDAVALLERIRAVGGHAFWSDEVSLAEDRTGLVRHLIGHRQITDAHLILLAHAHEGRVATFDRGMEELAAGILPDVVERIGSESD